MSPKELDSDFVPVITANFGKKGAQILIFFEFWLVFTVILLTNQFFYRYMFEDAHWLLIIMPLSIYGLIWQFAFYTALVSWVLDRILKWIEPPKEGEFELDGREFHYYCYRFWLGYYTIWMMRMTPLPWADMFAFRMLGIKAGKDVVLYDSWIDTEFVEIHDSVMLSLNSALFSHGITRDKFFVKRIIIKKNAIVGAESVVAPGTILEEGAVVGAGCTTAMNQHLSAYRIHVGTPATTSLPIKIIEEDEEK